MILSTKVMILSKIIEISDFMVWGAQKHVFFPNFYKSRDLGSKRVQKGVKNPKKRGFLFLYQAWADWVFRVWGRS